MKNKCLAAMLIMLILMTGCTATSDAESDEPMGEEMGEVSLTLEELQDFDGQDDGRTYIAVDGVIYDVSDVGVWIMGQHNGFSAGRDVTDDILGESPHGTSVLDNLPVVGKIIE